MKKLKFTIKPFVVLIAFVFSLNAFATDYYWINGGGNWNDPTHWSISSGGSSSMSVPGPTDNVIFDDNSFNAPYSKVFFNSNITVNDITFSSPEPFGIIGENYFLRVTGDFTTTHKFYSKFQTLVFDATGNHTISTAAGDIGANILFQNGTWELTSLLQTFREYSIEITGGTLISNGHSIAAGYIAANTNPVNLDFTGSAVIAFNTMDLSSAVNIGFGAQFISVDNEINPSHHGGFGGSSTFNRDTTHICTDFLGNPTGVILTVTDVDYNGYNVSCQDSCDGEITMSAIGTPGPYSYSWDNDPFNAQQTYTGICAGTYNARVKDSSQVLGPGIYQNCTTVEEINEPPKLFLDVLGPTVDVSCFGVCDGQAFTDPGGGIGAPYSVIWSPSGENTPFPVALCEGPNTVQVLDGNGCQFDTTLIVNGPPDIVPSLTITPPTCTGDCDAEVLVTPSGGNGGPYTYSWSPVPTSGQGTNPGVGFCAGTINLSTFDVDGCQKDTTFDIIDPPVLNITAAFGSNATCNGVCDGTATSNPTGGQGAYTFEWFTCSDVPTGITDQNPTTLCAGSYYVVVTDNGGTGCTDTSNCITITEPPVLLADAQSYPVSCFGVCDGSVDVDASGGTPFALPPPGNYTYSWVTVPGGSGVGGVDSLSGLCPGFYEVTVTDANGCTSEPDTVEVTEPPQLAVTIATTDPTCYDLCDGSMVATPSGGTAPYSYVWTPAPGAGQGTPTPSSMCAGIYTLDLTDDNGCTLQVEDTLNAPPTFDVTVNKTDLVCNGDSNGTIDITVNSGGSGSGYTYNWVPAPPVGQGTPNVSGLTAGTWCVTISDDMLCDTTICIDIIEPTLLTANASVISQVSCFGVCDGSAQVVIGGGVTPYSITWTPTGQTTLVASGLCAGPYTVDVVDDNGCTASDNVNIIEPGPFNLDTSHTDVSCFGDCTGTATANVLSGGSGPFSYSWAPSGQSTPTAINLCAGVHTVTITDNNLCDTVVSFTVIEPPALSIDTNVINSACFGACSGEANIDVTGGTAPYSFEWFDVASGLPLGVNNDSITGLCPGQYYAEVTDANGCNLGSDTITITELPEIFTSVLNVTDATCGLCDGTADVEATGGAGNFTYIWTPAPGGGQGTPNATGLCAGVYNVVATDQAGCSANIAVNVNSVALEVTSMDSTNISCFGLCDGQAQISYNVLDPPYTVEWFDAVTGLPIGIVDGPPASNPSVATGLCAGSYFAVLTNNSGCVTSDTVSISEPPQITGTVTPTDVTCNGACDGSATVVASGGTPFTVGSPYTYTWTPLPGSGQGTPTAGGLCAGNWDVTVTDSLGCNETFSTTISEPTVLIINSTTPSDISCFGANDGSASVLHTGGIPPHTYDWIDCNSGLSIGQTTQTASNLGPGDYQVVVTDANGCTATSPCVTVNEPTPITANTNISPVNCYGYCDGMIDVVPAGGTAPYFYQWQDEFFVDLPGQTNDTMNNVCQGIYNVEVTDFNGCTQTFGPFDMTSPTNPWNVNESQTNITCSGACDGTATVTVVSGNNPPYTYLWDDPLNQTSPTATNLCAGTYNVTISDAGICDTVITFTIADPNPIVGNETITHVLCFGDCTGEIALAPSGGTPPYTVTWSDLQIGDTAYALCAGPISATITDAAGCNVTLPFTITEPPELTATSSFSNNSACGACNGSATVNASGGVPLSPGPPFYNYVWSPAPGAGQGTNAASSMCPGVYSLDVTDANGCVYTEVFTISDVPSEVITVDSTDVSCFGECDGGVEVIYICSDPPCSNQWYDATTGNPLTGETGSTVDSLCAGDYFVEVINGSGCVSIAPISVGGPTQILDNDTITQITCNGANDATITLNPSGGSGVGYTYVWTPVPPNGQGTNQALNLGGGTYCVDITDSDGCTQSYCYTIVEPSAISITPTITDPLCNGDCNGIISVAVTGGYGSYVYQWYDGGGAPIPGANGSLISGLCAGNYTVEVTDAGGCVQTLFITLTEPSAVTSTITDTDVTCFGDCDGTATVNPSGGFSPYTVQWYNNTTGFLIGQTGTSATNLCPGFYHAVITDNNGCSYQTPAVEITQPAELTWTININDATCFGVCDGDAEIIPAGGTGPYTYEWLDISGSPIVGGSNPMVTNLCAGNYTVSVTDANGCTSGPQPVVINSSPQITGNVFTNNATCGVSDGNATINASGGTSPLTYQWQDEFFNPLVGETNNVLMNVSSGTYYVVVTDAIGCTETFQANISDNSSTTLTFDAVVDPSCYGSSDGSISITTTTANPPLTYTWNPGGLIAEDPTGLTAGTWTVQTTDTAGCINFFDTTLVDPPELIVTSTSTPSDCGQCNGTADLVVTGGTGATVINWSNGDTTASVTGLCPSIYEAQVTDQNGCLVTEQVEIPNNGGLTGAETIVAISCPGACDGAVTVTGVGGTAPYSYLWLHDNSTSDTQTNLCAGSYFVTITDAIGCAFAIEVVINDPAGIQASPTVNNPSCGNSDGSISVLTSGGVLPHTYLWNPGGSTNPSISGLAAGVYTLTVTDAAGCSDDFVYGLSNSSAPVATLTATNSNCANSCDGQIDTSAVIGGTPAFTYQWFDDGGAPMAGEINPLISGLCEGTYILELTDAVGCISYVNASITQPDTILLNPITAINPTCNGLCDGQLITNPIGGTLPFTYLWDNPQASTTVLADSLCDGTYNVVITDANGCTENQSGTVIEPSPIVIVTDSIIDATCWNSTDGEIHVTISGGTSPYTTQWVSQTLQDTFNVEDPVGIMPYDYYLTVTDVNGCTAMDTASVDTLISVIATVGMDTVICLNDSASVYGYSNVDPMASLTWYDTTFANVYSVTNVMSPPTDVAGTFEYIFIANYMGCNHSDTIFITVTDAFTVEAGPDIEMFSTQTETIGGSPTSMDPTHTYDWSPPDFLSDTTSSNPDVVEPQSSGWYYVTVTDSIGCTAIDSMYVELRPDIVIPDGISPDGNGLNDTWILDFIELYPGVDIQIWVYNRWGEPIFASDENYQDDWGGTTSDGKRLPAGTYYYTIEIDHEDFPEPFTGPITIMW
ncbi:MAG: gliding motility-associated C-terminal domain-containing protein [Crocinitomicaceae bacterium]|nr:gliding motility-associated C-terminal domain-containing protein [Crocinitomicaceae bacterium]